LQLVLPGDKRFRDLHIREGLSDFVGSLCRIRQQRHHKKNRIHIRHRQLRKSVEIKRRAGDEQQSAAEVKLLLFCSKKRLYAAERTRKQQKRKDAYQRVEGRDLKGRKSVHGQMLGNRVTAGVSGIAAKGQKNGF